MRQKMILLALTLSSSAFATVQRPGDPAMDAPIEIAEAEPQIDKTIFDKMVLELQTAPEHAGTLIGFQLGPYYQVVDRRAEKAAPKPAPAQTATERLLAQAIRSAGTTVAIQFTYERQGVDDKGNPVTEKVTVFVNAATGAAAEAQQSMSEAMGKQHR